jgi:dolichol kinase
MEKRLIFEFKRKFIHIFSLFFIIIYYLANKWYDKKTALFSLIILLAIFLLIEYFRIKKKKKIPILHIFWREREKDKLAGYIYFIIGAIIVFTFFDFYIAVTALLMATFGDMAAALIGIPFGKHWLKSVPHTAWEGIIAEFVVDIIIGAIILTNWYIIIAMALVATIVETFLIHIDDNLSIPLFAGLIGQILFKII